MWGCLPLSEQTSLSGHPQLPPCIDVPGPRMAGVGLAAAPALDAGEARSRVTEAPSAIGSPGPVAGGWGAAAASQVCLGVSSLLATLHPIPTPLRMRTKPSTRKQRGATHRLFTDKETEAVSAPPGAQSPKGPPSLQLQEWVRPAGVPRSPALASPHWCRGGVSWSQPTSFLALL